MSSNLAVVLAEEAQLANLKVPFLKVSAADTAMDKNVLGNHVSFKYYFQPSPANSTALALYLIQFNGYLHAVTNFTKSSLRTSQCGTPCWA